LPPVLRGRGAGGIWVDGGCKKWLFRGGNPTKIREKAGG